MATDKRHPGWLLSSETILKIVPDASLFARVVADAAPWPLAVGAGITLHRMADEAGASAEQVKALHRALAVYCNNFAYLDAVASDQALRWTVTGEPIETVSDQHRDYALRRMALMQHRSASKAPAQTHPAQTHPAQTHPAQTHPAQTHPAPGAQMADLPPPATAKAPGGVVRRPGPTPPGPTPAVSARVPRAGGRV